MTIEARRGRRLSPRHRMKVHTKVARPKACPKDERYKRLFTARPNIMHQYLHHQGINQYLDYVKHRYPLFVTVHTLGESYEGRPLKGIEIDFRRKPIKGSHQMRWKTKRSKHFAKGTTPTTTPTTPSLPSKSSDSMTTTEDNRNLIFIEGGTHGREWLTISVALHIIHQLTEKHIRNMPVLRRFRFFIVPLSNPDGYEFTLNTNLRWRKNRRPTSAGGKHCGVDCNRNYDFHWDKGSTDESGCSYKGEKPFSEPETRALSATLQNLAPNLLLFISLHSYAQAIMYPWGCTRDPPENINELQAIASAGCYAIRAFSGRNYRTGSIVKLSSRIIGGSIVDYAYGVIKVPYAYVIELPNSSFGFQPPAEVIPPIGEECWLALREMCYCAETLYTSRPPRLSLLQRMREKYGKAFALAKQMLNGDECLDKINSCEFQYKLSEHLSVN